MLKQRIITAIVLFAIIVASLLVSPTAFLALVAVAMGCCLWEWLRICQWNSQKAAICGIIVAMALFSIEVFAPEAIKVIHSDCFMLLVSGVGTFIWTILTALVFIRRHQGWQVSATLGTVLAWILVPVAWYSLVWLFNSPERGILYTLSVLAIVWIADIGAFFVGMNVGGPKMATAISPKKTWSGAIGAIFLVIIAGWCFARFLPQVNLWSTALFNQADSIGVVFVLLFITVIFSVAGDLFESALKRSAGVKDSSNLLPGHGGVYDRIDAQMAVLPLSVFIVLLLKQI